MPTVAEPDTAASTADLVGRARRFAKAAHRGVGQLRKYSGKPYEVHLQRVAEMVAQVTDDPETIAAAWLHDVVEDTPTTFEDIERAFGTEVRQLVFALTDVSRPEHGNRAERKALDRAHLAKAPARAQTVKLADLINNCNDICTHNPRFGRVFVDEMSALLDVLSAGDATLMKRARKTLDKWRPRMARVAAGEAATPVLEPHHRRAVQILATSFRVRDVAEPLPVYDAGSDAGAIGDAPLIGVRSGAAVVGYRLAATGSPVQPIEPTQLIDEEASLVGLVVALGRHEWCLVQRDGAIVGYAGRPQLQGPLARMWLFGMVTSVEGAFTERIRVLCDERRFDELLSPARLDKARALQQSRHALGRATPLLDCLQLADKVRILLAVDDTPRALLQGHSKAESQRLVRDLEDLRNSLAHAQDIVTHDWTQIGRLALRLQELAQQQRKK